MTHLKHCGPIRQGRALKRTSLIEIHSEETASNEGDLTEADLEEIDRQFAARKAADPYRQAECDRAQREELARDPMGGFLA